MSGRYVNPGYAHNIVSFDSQQDICSKCGIVGPADTTPPVSCHVK